MCATCGCSDDAGVRVTDLSEEHRHGHGHGHPHRAPVRAEPDTRTVALEVDLLAKNDDLAGRNRRWLADRGVIALNLMSSPGSGKTTLLTRTIRDLGDEVRCAVLEGDQETLIDAQRIGATGARVIQINTGAGCHLDAAMLARGLTELDPPAGSLVFVENVGNLVCPALFDLGEAAKVVVVSVTEGEDKPLKYPYMFSVADVVVINKIDLLPYVDVRLDRLVAHCRSVNADALVLPLSVTTGEGTAAWGEWLLTCEPVLT